MQKLVILDIDGCILDPSPRIGYYLKGDLLTYKQLYLTDLVIDQGVFIYKQFLSDPQFKCVFVTSRREDQRKLTSHQLRILFDIPQTALLLMRPKGCSKEQLDDAELKPWLVEDAGLTIKSIFLAIDDRQAVVDEWRRRGVMCYQPEIDKTVYTNTDYIPTIHNYNRVSVGSLDKEMMLLAPLASLPSAENQLQEVPS